ncbi:MAG: hypothetical protein U5K72_12680 [Balneolaceae bacterium]|nr:hypothetical protein [Balneolaceae bacterium]
MLNLWNQAELLCKRNILFYRIWFFLNKNKLDPNIKLPDKKDDLYLDGYPRSGNTYLKSVVSSVFENISFAHHLHTIAGMKLAKSRRVPCIIIFRKPIDAVTSLAFTKKNRSVSPLSTDVEILLQQLLDEWLQYYQYVLNNHYNITLLNFEMIKTDEIKVLQIVANTIQLNKTIKEEHLRDIVLENKLRMKRKETMKEDAISSLPNENRRNQKKKYKAILAGDPKLREAEQLFEKLVQVTKGYSL